MCTMTPTRWTSSPWRRRLTGSHERVAARFGLIDDAPPVIGEGSSLPLVGALLILPALAATGLLDTAARVFGTRRRAFYGLRSLSCRRVLLPARRAPGRGTHPHRPARPRAPARSRPGPRGQTLRRRTEELAARAARRVDRGLARRHLAAHEQASGVFYVDGHVRAYHGGREMPKAHVARIRLAMPAEVDTWVADPNGDGVLVWRPPPGPAWSASCGW